MLAIKKILIPIDFSENSQKSLIYGLSIAEQFNAEVHTLTIIDDRVYEDRRLAVYTLEELIKDQIDEQNAKLDKVIEEVLLPSQKKLPIIKVNKIDIPTNAIVEYAEDEAVDLIIMGTHGRTGFAHFLLGSTTEKVIRKAKCSVLVTKLVSREFVVSPPSEKKA